MVYLLLLVAGIGGAQSNAQSLASCNQTIKSKSVRPPKAEVSIAEPVYRILGLRTVEQDGKMLVSWSKTGDVQAFRHDNGTVVDGISMNNAGPRAVLGVLFKDVRLLERIFWTLYDVNQPNDRAVNLYVFDLTENGTPGSLLYREDHVACRSLEANHFDFCTPLETPRGCFIALSAADGRPLSLGMDSGLDREWPFVPKVNYSSSDYAGGRFVSADGQGITANLFIRCYGETKAVSETAETYKLWRFAADKADNPADWTLLTASLDQPSFEDAGYASLPIGVYRYAVDLADAVEAQPVVSCPVYKDMFTAVSLSVATTVDNVSMRGTSVSLVGKQGVMDLPTYAASVPANGNVSWEAVMKGIYTLKITKAGFEPVEREVDLSEEDRYDLGRIVLNEYRDAPWNLSVEKTAVPGSRKIEWNKAKVMTDNVEGHADFAINSPGALGWSYIDADGGTPYGIQNCTFPNTGKPLAFMAFNPSLTSPAMSNLPAAIAHSGQKYFAAFANMPAGAGQTAPANNDFIISPALTFETDFIFDFWAKTYEGSYPESFRVRYSVSGKEQADFVHELTAGPVVAPAAWTNFSYQVPKEAKYVAVNYVSEDKFIFMLDDLRFTEVWSYALPHAFEVSLNGIVKDTVSTPQIDLTGLTKGTYTLGIKALYQTGVSEVTTYEFEVADVAAGIKAVVKDMDGMPLSGVRVSLDGDFDYVGFSNSEGAVTVDPVQGQASYAVSVEANGYKTHTQQVTLTDAVLDLGEIKLQDRPLPPGALFATESADAKVMELSWRAPTDYQLFRKDDGRVQGGLGSNTGDEKTVVGAVHATATELYSISWFTATQGVNTINLFVFDVDNSGMPTKTILWEKHGVENVGMQWNTLQFDSPVRCPRGFLIGVSGTTRGNVGLGADSGKDSLWPFVPKTNYLIQDYTDAGDAFGLLDQQFARNLMIRAEGSVGLSAGGPAVEGSPAEGNTPKAATGYKVYRSDKVDDGAKAESWHCLTPQPVAQTSFTDAAWGSLERGYYRYAVRSFYLNGDSSDLAYSNRIGRQMSTAVRVAVVTTDGQPADSACVRLSVSPKEVHTGWTAADGTVWFESLPTGVYDLQISKEGYADFVVYGMDFSSEPTYQVGPYRLSAPLPKPTGLTVETTDDPSVRIVRWDALADETDGLFYLLDDNRKAGFYTYEIYLDSVRLGETAETFYRLGNLTNGRHKVGVRAKSGYSASAMVEKSFLVQQVGLERQAAAEVQVYPNPVTDGRLEVRCPAEDILSVSLADLTGRTLPVRVSGSGAARTVVLEEAVSGMVLLTVRTSSGLTVLKIMVL